MKEERINEIKSNIEHEIIVQLASGYRTEVSRTLQEKIELFNALMENEKKEYKKILKLCYNRNGEGKL